MKYIIKCFSTNRRKIKIILKVVLLKIPKLNESIMNKKQEAKMHSTQEKWSLFKLPPREMKMDSSRLLPNNITSIDGLCYKIMDSLIPQEIFLSVSKCSSSNAEKVIRNKNN